jgi:transcription elongation GreA/GreB family factor
MKKISAIALALCLLRLSPGLSIAAAPTPPPPQVLKGARPEQHPHIRAAIKELREARHELETAAHDFGGHRKEAIAATDQAIKQLQQALEYDTFLRPPQQK